MSPAEHLDAETAALQALLAVLRQEQALLVAGDADRYASLLDPKAAHVAELSQRADQRHRALGSLGFAASEAGMQQWLASSSDATRSVWDTLMELARTAHEVNLINGMLLGQLQARNCLALEILGRGNLSGLYSASGQTERIHPATRAARVTG